MSLVNLTAGVLTPEYQTMYLVHTPDMDKARDDGGEFDGIVAAVNADRAVYEKIRRETWEFRLRFFVAGVLLLAPIAIIGTFSGFRANESTAAQRGWMMS